MAVPQREVLEFPTSERQVTRNTRLGELPEFLTVDEMASFLGLGRDAAYSFAHQHGVRIGRYLRVPRSVLEGLTNSGSK